MMKMKSTLQLILVASLSLLAACCGSEKNLVEQSADKYLNAMANYNFFEAKKYCTPQTQQVTLDYIEKEIMPYMDSSYMQRNTPATIQIKKVKMTSDSTATVYYHKVTPINKADDSLQLIKFNEEWRANQVIVRPGEGKTSKLGKKKPNPFKEAKAKAAQEEQESNKDSE